jgi:hypothetical protein
MNPAKPFYISINNAVVPIDTHILVTTNGQWVPFRFTCGDLIQGIPLSLLYQSTLLLADLLL